MRRNFTLLATAILFTLSLNAQTEKGSVYVGGSLAFVSSNVSNSSGTPVAGIPTVTTFAVTPSVGWAYKDNHFMGFGLGYSNVNNKDPLNKYSANEFNVFYFLRQYKPLGKGFYLFGQEVVSVGFGTGKATGYNEKIFNSGLSVNPGMAYNVSKHMQLELQLVNLLMASYSSNKSSSTDNINYPSPNDSKQFVFSTTLDGTLLNNVSIGIRFFL